VQDDGAPDSIEATRRKILDAAVDVSNEVGYSAAERGAIIERAEMTKGALQHDFDSMESLASGIIERAPPQSSAPFAATVKHPRLQWRT
jgi:AcrR family transcriptional regulator